MHQYSLWFEEKRSQSKHHKIIMSHTQAKVYRKYSNTINTELCVPTFAVSKHSFHGTSSFSTEPGTCRSSSYVFSRVGFQWPVALPQINHITTVNEEQYYNIAKTISPVKMKMQDSCPLFTPNQSLHRLKSRQFSRHEIKEATKKSWLVRLHLQKSTTMVMDLTKKVEVNQKYLQICNIQGCN